MVWTKTIYNDSAWEVRVKNHGTSEDFVIPPRKDLDYNREVGKSGSGIEVEFQRTRTERMAVMIVDEGWRLKFSSAAVHHGQEKLFVPFKELVVLKHYAEFDIIFENGRKSMSINDVSQPNDLEKLNNNFFGWGFSTLNGETNFIFPSSHPPSRHSPPPVPASQSPLAAASPSLPVPAFAIARTTDSQSPAVSPLRFHFKLPSLTSQA
ncbi:hypothetical protein L484_020615 [Morus notabilis]|uniref:Uncharacterized protein n=1 Tax=Morus notabilis TaxID=981085 RepID=W9SJI6_9ROSA|nr:hypothetical protein L484_020615 [Morus notabilis]